ncbi:M67 family metallopeptidase [Microcoleus sp. FACHB-1515]|uniref:M67 family metallopeptidase n=1 Tax=Cyanophyceae TaxID=3028117 RepID=UPI001689063B|nr:M67 family metallopeptidase [Microcoleus sp. FACHB-1515]MBD2088859.1 M67 family metallopeptidase [Microcoleus sp. FACHB-1515]
MTLILTSDHLQQIQSHAQQTYPHECCGLILGHLEGDRKQVLEIHATQNAWSGDNFDTKRRYTIDPYDMMLVQKSSRDRNLNIIGIYHSHPDCEAVPSECDRLAAWPQYSYLIVSVHQGVAQDCLCWTLDDEDQFQREPFTISHST